MEIFRATRPIMGLFAAMLCLVSFRMQGLMANFNNLGLIATSAVTVWAVTNATMIWNDYTDRAHDVSKGKTAAASDPELFLLSAMFLWLVAVVSFLILAWMNLIAGWLALLGIGVGLMYGYARLVPMLSAILVSTAAAGVVLYPLALGPKEPVKMWFLAVAVFCLIFARETLKDLEDLEFDPGYKQTLPLVFGSSRAKLLAGVILYLAMFCAIWLTQGIAFNWLSWLLLGIGAFFLVTHRRQDPKIGPKIAKLTTDLAMTTFLVIVWLGN